MPLAILRACQLAPPQSICSQTGMPQIRQEQVEGGCKQTTSAHHPMG
jgi:hypothetical protein